MHKTLYHGSIFLAFCVDCAVQCFDSLLLVGRCTAERLLITFAGSSSQNLTTMTSTFVLIDASPRTRSSGSTSSVRVQRVGCTTDECNFNEVPCISCSDTMQRRCDAAMRRRCNCDATAQTAMQSRRNRRRNRRRRRRNRHRFNKIQTRYMFLFQKYRHHTGSIQTRYCP